MSMNKGQSASLRSQSPRRGAELLSGVNLRPLLDSVDAFLFDCDGVIWKGDKLIDGVPQTLDMLRSMGTKLVFVTNNSTKSRSQYAHKFNSLGLSVTQSSPGKRAPGRRLIIIMRLKILNNISGSANNIFLIGMVIAFAFAFMVTSSMAAKAGAARGRGGGGGHFLKGHPARSC